MARSVCYECGTVYRPLKQRDGECPVCSLREDLEAEVLKPGALEAIRERLKRRDAK